MKNKLFLIRTRTGKETTVRLPINSIGLITQKGLKIIRDRFNSSLDYALNLETFTTGNNLIEAITKYKNGIL